MFGCVMCGSFNLPTGLCIRRWSNKFKRLIEQWYLKGEHWRRICKDKLLAKSIGNEKLSILSWTLTWDTSTQTKRLRKFGSTLAWIWISPLLLHTLAVTQRAAPCFIIIDLSRISKERVPCQEAGTIMSKIIFYIGREDKVDWSGAARACLERGGSLPMRLPSETWNALHAAIESRQNMPSFYWIGQLQLCWETNEDYLCVEICR